MTCLRRPLLLLCSVVLLSLVPCDTTARRPAAPDTADRKVQLLRLSDGARTFTILVAANADLYNLPPGVRRVVVRIEADSLSNEAASAPIDGTLVLVPQFMIGDGRTTPPDLPVWHDEQAWASGERSSAGAAGLCAFTLLDALVGYLKRSSHFPQLQEVVFVGRGTAAELVERHGMRPQVAASFRIRHLREQLARR